VSPLRISVAAGETGPVVTLSGKADLSTAAELSEVLTRQASGGPQHLTVDISGLSFADSVSVRTLALAGRAMKDRGGALELTNPQPTVARLLSLMGVDQMITVRAAADAGSHAEDVDCNQPPA
jgi:stage II sporulation protein AA (anti-sigma F factor antagonist)